MINEEQFDNCYDLISTAAKLLKRNTDVLADDIKTLKEILDKAESWDYGLKGWRKLETKQDLIDAIKKEVLGE